MAYKIMAFEGADFYDFDGQLAPINFTDKKSEKQYLPSKRFKIRFDDSLILDRFDQVLKNNKLITKGTFKVKGDLATDQIIYMTFKNAVFKKELIKKEDGTETIKRTDEQVLSTKEVREDLYINGVDINNIHYVRWIHSPSNARNGRVYFINQELEHSMNLFADFGLELNEKTMINLADVEATRGLLLSSKIDSVHIEPKNILVIEDLKSTFNDNVMFTTADEYGSLITKETEFEITNTIFDGQSLMDKSLFPDEYKDKGMLLLRHKAFKSCCFNANVQQWFKDNDITDISQLKGLHTPDATLEDIKLITTESSIKYKKFGNENWFYNWCEIITKHHIDFGIVKYEKPTKYCDGRLVRTNYQVMNTLYFENSELKELLKDTIDYMNNLLNDPILMYRHCKEYEENDFQTNEKFIAQMLDSNWEFSLTEYYGAKAKGVVEKIRSNVKQGQILVNGTFSTMLSCPIEMLKESIGQFDGTSTLKIGTIVSTKFPVKKLLVTRNPHICAGNLYVPINVRNETIQHYVNLTDNIVVVNTINENIMQRLGGADFDSDQVMIVNNDIMIDAAKRMYTKFKVPTTDISPKKNSAYYTTKNLAELDYKISNPLIGDIVNFSQVLNSLYWNRYCENKEGNEEELKDIYKDICQLSILSMLEIDRAKKDFGAISSNRELSRIKNKYKKPEIPAFFKEVDRHKGSNKKWKVKKNYGAYECTCDQMYSLVFNEEFVADSKPSKKIDIILNKDIRSRGKVDDDLITNLEAICAERKSKETDIIKDINKDEEEKYKALGDVRNEFINNVKTKIVDEKGKPKLKYINVPTVRKIVKNLDNATKDNKKIYEYELDALRSVESKALAKLIQNKNTNVPSFQYDANGDYKIYGLGFRVTQ